MTLTKLILVLVCLMSGTLLAQEAKVTDLMSKELPNFPGKEGLMITVDYRQAAWTQFIATTQMHLFMCWKVRS